MTVPFNNDADDDADDDDVNDDAAADDNAGDDGGVNHGTGAAGARRQSLQSRYLCKSGFNRFINGHRSLGSCQ